MGKSVGGLTAEEFVEKWSKAQLSERGTGQEHFIDLCNLLNQPTPGTDSTGDDYCFEKYVKVVGAASRGSKGDGGFVLFGSRARGTASAGSDADVMVVLHGRFDPDKELDGTSKLTVDISLKYGVAINRIFMNKKQADARAGPLQGNIARDALIL